MKLLFSTTLYVLLLWLSISLFATVFGFGMNGTFAFALLLGIVPGLAHAIILELMS